MSVDLPCEYSGVQWADFYDRIITHLLMDAIKPKKKKTE